MATPFPGMDPFLEHPVLWTGLHTRLVVALANQLNPLIRPRYIASVEERVFIESPLQDRIPDMWVQKARESAAAPDVSAATCDAPVIVEAPPLEHHEPYVEILDRYRDLKVVTVLELVSPTNKETGPGREAYLAKQREALGSECHLVEIDLLRRGRHVMSVPETCLQLLPPYHYLVCVNRWPQRARFELYPRTLRNRLPRLGLPLSSPDRDVPLDIQAALEQVYDDGGYMLRIRYDEPCVPALEPTDQVWANQCWADYQAAHPDLFPPTNGAP